MALTDDAHELIRNYFSDNNKPRKLAVDATCGNGHDTAFLANLGFKKIIAIDIQQQAVINTRERCKQNDLTNSPSTIEVIHDGHQNISRYINQPISCIIFNFGYLPLADKTITTQTDTSIDALNSAKQHLAVNGLISLMCYPGHPEGESETTAIKQWLVQLDEDWQVDTHLAISPKPTAPILFIVTPISF